MRYKSKLVSSLLVVCLLISSLHIHRTPSFSTSYSFTSLGYVENPRDLAEVLGTGSVHVDVFSSE